MDRHKSGIIIFLYNSLKVYVYSSIKPGERLHSVKIVSSSGFTFLPVLMLS